MNRGKGSLRGKSKQSFNPSEAASDRFAEQWMASRSKKTFRSVTYNVV